MRVSLIVTVFNEEKSVAALLDSIIAQSRQPDEVVIVDGGSSDRTVDILRSYEDKLPLNIIVEPGSNISRGRNLAIRAASGDIIASTDAGVRLASRWLQELIKPFGSSEKIGSNLSPVSCGFFIADPQTTFEIAMGATVLPSIEEIDAEAYLPSSRSIAYAKEAWQAVGGYPEWLDYCEDLIFDFNLRRCGYPFIWVPKAIVYLRPRSSLGAFFKQYHRYARGDGKANLWFKRHLVRYLSYLLAMGILIGGFWLPPLWALIVLGVGIHAYRPYRRLLPQIRRLSITEKIKAIIYVSVIRLVGDVAKMVGYPAGLWWRLVMKRALGR